MLTIETTSLASGTSAPITVSWTQPLGELTIRLGWKTSGKARSVQEAVATRTLSTGDAPGEGTVTVPVPASPPSYAGALFTVTWTIEVQPAEGDVVTAEVVVGPDGEPALPASPEG